jgi:molybdenum cofactor guanylyltransferase
MNEPPPPDDQLNANRCLAVVLAGGRSSRMGIDKATLLHRSGVSFLAHALERAKQVVPHVAISGRATTDDPAIACIADLEPAKGPAMAVYSSVEFAANRGLDAILVTPVDMPDLTVDDLRRLLAIATIHGPTCVTFDNGHPHPMVAVYPVALRSELRWVAESPPRSLRQWLERRAFHTLQLPSRAMNNINTPEHYSQANPP